MMPPSPSPDAASISAAKKAMAYALCQHASADSPKFPLDKADSLDIADLVAACLGTSLEAMPQVMKWLAFARDFPGKGGDVNAKLCSLNDELSNKSTLVGGNGFKTSPADVIIYTTVHPYLSHLDDTQTLPHLRRWMDYIQNVENFGSFLEKIAVTKPELVPFWTASRTEKANVAVGAKQEVSATYNSGKAESNGSAKHGAEAGTCKAKSSANDKEASTKVKSSNTLVVDEKPTKVKVGNPEDGNKVIADSTEKDAECNVSILNIQIGLIRKAHKHPSADSLLVEEIDLGDGNVRQVVSGLAKYCTPEELCNRYVVLITNVKPGKLRDVLSSGLVLCASNEDHTVVEPLAPPEGAKIGERVSFSGYEGKPEEVLNPKKKQLDKITPHFYTDEQGIATFKGIPFMTSAGPCKSSIPKASIK